MDKNIILATLSMPHLLLTIFALATIALTSSCASFNPQPTGEQKILDAYACFTDQPSKERLLDLLVLCCVECDQSGEAHVVMMRRLQEPNRIAVTIDDVDFTDHDIVLGCLDSFGVPVGYMADFDRRPLREIISRRVGDDIYRFHIMAVEPDDATRLSNAASIWINGYEAGRQSLGK